MREIEEQEEFDRIQIKKVSNGYIVYQNIEINPINISKIDFGKELVFNTVEQLNKYLIDNFSINNGQ